MASKKNKPWGGIFSKETHPLLEQFNASIHFDRTLYAEDVAGSIAYARALCKAGIISSAEQKKMERGLLNVQKDIEKGKVKFTAVDEDIHMGIEKRLVKYIGETADKLHTGRSRNEQVALDERMYLKQMIKELKQAVSQLQWAVVRLAEKQIDIIMPGYTHLQPAQLVRFSHYLLALFFMLQRDQGRLAGCFQRCDILPLGSGALGGNALGLDRKFLARELGFKAVSDNSIDAVSDRDFIIEFLGACAIIAMHLSRFCEDLIIWSTPEFGFVTLDEQFATGSSLMPQKKNPDSLELVRGKSGRIYGNLFALLTVMKGLPLAYAKDLQEDKEPLFDTVWTTGEMVQVFTGVIRTLKVNKKAITQQIGNSLYATDLVEHLVKQGVAFRKAHQQVGTMIRKGTFIQALEKAGLTDPQRSVDRKNTDGGTSRASITRQLTAAKKMLGKGSTRI